MRPCLAWIPFVGRARHSSPCLDSSQLFESLKSKQRHADDKVLEAGHGLQHGVKLYGDLFGHGFMKFGLRSSRRSRVLRNVNGRGEKYLDVKSRHTHTGWHLSIRHLRSWKHSTRRSATMSFCSIILCLRSVKVNCLNRFRPVILEKPSTRSVGDPRLRSSKVKSTTLSSNGRSTNTSPTVPKWSATT